MPTATAPASQTCPFCAEIILASAIKCRHCGEFLEASEKRAQIKRPLPKGLVDEPNAAEYFVALIIAPIGLIIGAVWALQRQAKAKRMLQASILSCVILSVGALMLRAYVWKDSSEEDGPSIPANAPVAPNNYYVVVPQTDEDEGPTPRPAPRQGSSSSEMAGLVNLEGQPEHVQRAMRANVRIEMEREQSMGSGVVLQREDDDVLILTNRHVIDATQTPKPPDLRGLPKPRITYYDDQSNRGTVVWIAPDGIDLALVRVRAPKDIDAVGWTVAPKVLAGQEVFAVGNPVGLGWTYTKGVVSALRQRNANGREIPVIQTDTSITYGNSGGGLYSLAGELIGINSSIADPRLGGGLGFAIRPQILIDLKPPGLKLPEETPPHN
jgi:S1-C subfamily serine protease